MTPTTTTDRIVATPHELTDFRPIKLQVTESADGTGKVRVRGEFARCDQATQNGRVYSRSLFEREVGRMTKDLSARKVFGELDHPTDGRTLLTRVSHVITGLEVQEDGTVIGEADILDTSRGQDLKALLKSGCSVGVSSRGTGSTKTLKDGKEEVQEDYRLMTFDFVAEPADQTAYPKTFFESIVGGQALPEGTTVEQLVQQAQEDTALKVENQMRLEFASKLPLLIEKLKADLRAEVQAELLADPSIAGAKAALEQVKTALRPFVLPDDIEKTLSERDSEMGRLRNAVASRDLKIKELEDDGAKLESMARAAGFKYFVERSISGDENGEVIRAALGDLTGYATLDLLKAKLESVQAELTAKKQKAVEEAAQRAAEAAALKEAADKARAEVEAEKNALLKQLEVAEAAASDARAKVLVEAKAQESEQAQLLSEERAARQAAEAQLTARVDDLQEALTKAVAANKIQALGSYIERKIAGHQQAGEIRLALNDQINEDTSRQEIDEFIDSFPVPIVNEDADNVRSRVRRLTRGGRQPGAIVEEKQGAPAANVGRGGEDDSDYLGLGSDVKTLRKLSGLG
jgi:hypothetical protein